MCFCPSFLFFITQEGFDELLPLAVCWLRWVLLQVLGERFRKAALGAGRMEQPCSSQQGSGGAACASHEGELLHWHHLPWCLQHSSPLSGISPLLPAECIAAVLFSFPNPALPVLLSALLLILFFMYFFLISSGLLSGKYSPSTQRAVGLSFL